MPVANANQGKLTTPPARAEASHTMSSELSSPESPPIESLFTVLGDAHVLNNLTTLSFAVGLIPGAPRDRQWMNERWVYHAPDYLVGDAVRTHPDCLDVRSVQPRATPEKALMDWLVLAAWSGSALGALPLDIDMDEIDAERLRRIAEWLGMTALLDDFLLRKAAFDENPMVQSNGTFRRGLGA